MDAANKYNARLAVGIELWFMDHCLLLKEWQLKTHWEKVAEGKKVEDTLREKVAEGMKVEDTLRESLHVEVKKFAKNLTAVE